MRSHSGIGHSGIGIVDYLLAGTVSAVGADLLTTNVWHFPMFDDSARLMSTGHRSSVVPSVPPKEVPGRDPSLGRRDCPHCRRGHGMRLGTPGGTTRTGAATSGRAARSPVPNVSPAGRTVPVGAIPEGVVADPQTHIVAVGVRDPFALVLLDANTGTVVRKVSLPGELRHLQLAAPGGPVLVPDEGSNRLIRVALSSGEITSQVLTGVVPHDATQAANGTVFVANELGNSVVAVRGDQIVHTFTDVIQPAGLAAVGDLVGLVDVRGGAVLRYELSPQTRQIARIELPGTPYGVAYDPVRDRLWVTLTARNEVVGLDLGADPPAGCSSPGPAKACCRSSSHNVAVDRGVEMNVT